MPAFTYFQSSNCYFCFVLFFFSANLCACGYVVSWEQAEAGDFISGF